MNIKFAEIERHARAGRYTPAAEVVELCEAIRALENELTRRVQGEAVSSLEGELTRRLQGGGSGKNGNSKANTAASKSLSLVDQKT